ncbi:MAG: hypothetical protein M3Z66_15485 [Chloroflexota bacterium]|nr:hypothetical protein [Chloroflexota bacterium]
MTTSSGQQTVLIGTTNAAKFARYRRLLRDAFDERVAHIVSPGDVICHLHIVEDGQTAADNACKKARGYAKASGLATLAVDEALAIAGLPEEDQPGLHVRRYGGREQTDEELVRVLLEKTQHIAPSERAAIWTWALCLVVPGSGEYVEDVTIHDGLAAEVRTPIPSGYPLSAILVDTVTGKRVCELTEQEAAVRLSPVREAIDRLVQAAFIDTNAS